MWRGIADSLRDDQSSLNFQNSDEIRLELHNENAAAVDATSVLKLLAPTDDERMVGRLEIYEVFGVVGSGGMGVVLKAFEPPLNRYVAIKVLAPHLGTSGTAQKRFSREAQAAAAVVHENVIEIYSVAEAADLPYLVMPYLRGPSLQRRLDEQGPLALPQILRIAMQAAAGLAAAHAQGLVHRDVKPANILLADGIERVKLTDFGLARAADDISITKTGIIAGTPQYMSPEQARGESMDYRSDLFSLGSVMYATCTGRPPFLAETSYGVLRRVIDDEPRAIREINPDIPEWLCQIIAKLMSKQPEGRFASAHDLGELLKQCLAHVQQPVVVPLPANLPEPKTASTPTQAAQFLRKKLYIGGIAAVLILSIGSYGVFSMAAVQPPPITYLDAVDGPNGNTQFATGHVFIARRGTLHNDNQWSMRLYGNGVTVFTSNDGRGADTEDAPQLVTTISGLEPGAAYNTFAYFWSDYHNWQLEASLNPIVTGDPATRFSKDQTETSAAAQRAVARDFTAPIIVTEANRNLYQASLGKTIADPHGQIRVWIDDNANASEVNRTWYDGVGYSSANRFGARELMSALVLGTLALALLSCVIISLFRSRRRVLAINA